MAAENNRSTIAGGGETGKKFTGSQSGNVLFYHYGCHSGIGRPSRLKPPGYLNIGPLRWRVPQRETDTRFIFAKRLGTRDG